MRRWMSVLRVVAFVAAVAACQPQSATQSPDEVTVQLKWVHQAQFAGMYVAQERGYYAGEGLRVNFLEGGAGIDNVEAITSGRAQFAVTTPEDTLTSRSRKIPLKAIAAIYRRSAVVFLAQSDSRIARPRDFMGKTVAAGNTGGANRDFELQLAAMMKKLGLDIAAIRLVPYDPQYTAFLDGSVEVTAAFSTAGLIRLRQKGLKLNLIWPGDYGVHFYSDCLVTTDGMIRDRPELVSRFLRATLRGWREAVGNAPEAVAMTLKYARVKDSEFQMSMMESLMPLVHTGEDTIGWMRPGVWEGMYQALLDQGILKVPFDVSQSYTIQLLAGIAEGGDQ